MALTGAPYEAPLRTVVQIDPVTGAPVTNSASSTPASAATSTGSGTITTGGTAQQLVAAKANRRGLSVGNVSSDNLWISELTTAVAAQPSIRIPPGQEYIFAPSYGYVPVGAVSIIGPTTGQAFTVREW